ncbi:hypothetical protein GRI97_07120 [Altererythrobacter xixiisoli]|uniref:Uncharacterized protein n=1 Tax=Croceibacterium xixiisoli TaxID=1476466 RepID=A0A6I4TWN8_9SPHN|nr:hypothetical protein [Croceibacterium xixiisoli]MXO98753.1 hypothetical protein [Croceibacterium xixiisoli]
MFNIDRCKPLVVFALPLLACVASPTNLSGAVDGRVVRMVQPRLEAEPVLGPDADTAVTAGPQAATLNSDYPFYMPMQQLRRPAMVLTVKCEASQAAGKEVYGGRDGAAYYGRAEGGIEIVYDAQDRAGRPCVYPFAPAMPQTAGNLDGTQYIIRSSIPGQRAVFRTSDQWATINLRMFELGRQRVHFEMRDIEIDFPGAVQARGALHLEVVGSVAPGLFTAVVRRSKIFGGKNGIFVPGGQTMLYIEDSDIAGNVGGNVDQEHSTYINGTLVSHFRNSVWRGQLAWKNIASGHQLKDKAYLRIYEDLIVSNQPSGETASAMPLVDISAFGFTWSNNLQLRRFEPAQAPRDSLVDLRTEILYGQPDLYPWDVMVNRGWQMPADPLTALDQVYLSVFMNTQVESFRDEPYVFALRPQGTNLVAGSNTVEGNERTTRAQQRLVSIAFNTSGHVRQAYSREGWTYSNPQLPPGAMWIKDRDAFIRHALGLIGR